MDLKYDEITMMFDEYAREIKTGLCETRVEFEMYEHMIKTINDANLNAHLKLQKILDERLNDFKKEVTNEG